ncbi:peptidase B (aminopeptidase B) [Escherichia coli]|uniref:Peptidase B (Aminopeptidase B) n=1 Tax=Escherichia coli TaxID=562 RepID=A0A376W899_ECOLX|nr:peptidase B (aminopeptidase B) [Escherichia coli]
MMALPALNGADDLGLIQRAARKIDGLGIKHVQLSGEGWDGGSLLGILARLQSPERHT